MLRSAVKRPQLDSGVLNILGVSVGSTWVLHWPGIGRYEENENFETCLYHREDHAGGKRDTHRTLVNLQRAPSGQSREGPLTMSLSLYLGGSA